MVIRQGIDAVTCQSYKLTVALALPAMCAAARSRGSFSFKYTSKNAAKQGQKRWKKTLANGRTIYATSKAPTVAGQVRLLDGNGDV